ncbi:MAG: F0F1 ATP synthase subunit gamma [Limimaricola sp.]|uniref:F0F1 ATP synthase subunit gamma n=1 Tax=Limimaricola sp. TaxID=2211665 RepID=UPI001DD33E10|nr:F0F1 ATP synthase subunit gamma [Limimaricola sp.]MBI1418210.1 F0F1 ATP synthase subunit gamma [Limimaricola sp.]
MTERPEDITTRMGNIAQIETVVLALRGLATAQAQEARRHLAAAEAHAATVTRAMAQALAHDPATFTGSDSGPAAGPALMIVIGASQGFSGAYSERIVSAAAEARSADPALQLMVLGQRCISECDDRGLDRVWDRPMPAHVDEIAGLASRVVDALFTRLAQQGAGPVRILHARPSHDGQPLVTRQLLPFDPAGVLPATRGGGAPLLTLPVAALMAALIEEWVFAEICAALLVAHTAENEARMTAMMRAKANLQDLHRDLRRDLNAARQAQTTTEIIELSAGRL